MLERALATKGIIHPHPYTPAISASIGSSDLFDASKKREMLERALVIQKLIYPYPYTPAISASVASSFKSAKSDTD